MLMLLKVFWFSRDLSEMLALDAGVGMVARVDRMVEWWECWSELDGEWVDER
jgi:hypothetical protein